MADVVDPLLRWATQSPERVALLDDAGDRICFDELNRRSNRWSNMLAELGIGPGDVCLQVQQNSVAAFEIFHGVQKLGAIATSASTAIHPRELAAMIESAEVCVLVCDESALQLVSAARGLLDETQAVHVLAVSSETTDAVAAAPDTEPSDAGRVGIPTLSFTSGTLGVPKGVFRPQGIDPEAIAAGLRALGMVEGDVHLMAGPMHHSGPWGFGTLQHLIGATCIVMRRFDPQRVLELITRERVTTTFMAPAMIRCIVDLPSDVLKTCNVAALRLLLVTGAPFHAELKLRALDFFGDCVYESYGSTETGMVTLIGPEEMRARPESVGRPMEGVEVRILDADGASVGPGEPGLLWARGPSLFDGYLQGAADTFSEGFFTAGDVAYADGEGYLYICDREDDLINIGGTKVYPNEIEAVLQTHPAVADSVVFGVPDARLGEGIAALVEVGPDAKATSGELLAHCARNLAPLKVPWTLDIVDDVGRDPSGKLHRRRFRENNRM